MKVYSLVMKLPQSLKETILDFCSGSSIAGLQHAGDPARSALYRISWSIIIALAFALASVMLWNSVKGIELNHDSDYLLHHTFSE